MLTSLLMKTLVLLVAALARGSLAEDDRVARGGGAEVVRAQRGAGGLRRAVAFDVDVTGAVQIRRGV